MRDAAFSFLSYWECQIVFMSKNQPSAPELNTIEGFNFLSIWIISAWLCVKTEQPIIVLYEKCEENLFRWLELWLHTDCSWFGWIWTYMYWHTGFCITVILMLLNVQIFFFFFKMDLECTNSCFCRYLRLRVMLLKIPMKRFQQE